MFEKLSTDQYFDIIKTNHKEYIEANIVTHLDFVTDAINKKFIVERYQTHIAHYHRLQKSYLEQAIRSASMGETVGMGVTATLIGMGISGLFFAQQQRTPSADFLGTTAVTQGGFSAMIGASCAALIYKTWQKSAEKPAQVDKEECLKQMHRAGFSDARYDQLSQDLVKLFHFRECLLLGLDDNNHTDMREGFKKSYFPESHQHEFNDEDFNLSIEIYFLSRLNDFFHRALQDIYQIHNQEIDDDHGFNGWIKKHFASDDNRQRFTQQMQIEFITQCVHFLELQMSEPSSLAKYIYLIDSIAGLIAGAIAVGVLGAFIPVIPVLGLVGVGIVSASLAAVSTHLAIANNDLLKYERSHANRTALQNAIQRIDNERKRLTQLISKVVKTTHKDLNDLKNYDEQGNSSFLKIMRGQNPNNLFIGSVHSWMREFAGRFQDSQFIVLDLSERVKAIVDDAYDQTRELQELLMTLRTTTSFKDPLKELRHHLKDTRHYLQHPDNQAFINTFESVQKIREQILEIVGYSSLIQPEKGLPSILVDFYTDPLSKGGLGGLKSDLIQAKRLAPIVSETVGADRQHPYRHLLDTAFTINLKLNAAKSTLKQLGKPSALILQGDSQYRKMLGLPAAHIARIEDHLQIGNIEDYLNASFDFLCSLNEYHGHHQWHQSFQNHDQFVLYRTLLVKQLANLADPNNIRVDPLIKEAINAFIRIKLNGDPDVALDDILHQAWLMKAHKDPRTIPDQFGNSHRIGALASIADAIRVDITYVSNPLSPEKLITFEALEFLKKQTHPFVFACLASKDIVPEYSEEFFSLAQQTMDSTHAFIEYLKTKPLLQQTGAMAVYILEVVKEVDRLIRQMNVLLLISEHPDREAMQGMIQTLERFKTALPVIPGIPESEIAADILLVEYFDIDEEHKSSGIAHWLNAATRHSPIHAPLRMPDKESMKEAIKALESIITKEESKHGRSSFSLQSKADPKLIEAATRLKNAFTQFQNDESVEEYDWNQDPIYSANRSLSPIVKQYCPEGLNHFFAGVRTELNV